MAKIIGFSAAAHRGEGGLLGRTKTSVFTAEYEDDESPRKKLIREWYMSGRTQRAISILIVINFIVHGLNATSWVRENPRAKTAVSAIDDTILWMFVVELGLNMWCHWFKPFWRSRWNIFDFVLIVSSVFYFFVAEVGHVNLSIMVVVPVIRTLRVIKVVPKLRKIVAAMGKALPSIMWLLVLIFGFLGIYSIIGVELYRDLKTLDGQYPWYFKNISGALFTLFQTMTFESWASAITRPYQIEMLWSWVYFVSFLVLSSFLFLNIFTALFLEGMHGTAEVTLVDEETGEILETITTKIGLTDAVSETGNESRRVSIVSSCSSRSVVEISDAVSSPSLTRLDHSPSLSGLSLSRPDRSPRLTAQRLLDRSSNRTDRSPKPHPMKRYESYKGLPRQGSLRSVAESLHEEDTDLPDINDEGMDLEGSMYLAPQFEPKEISDIKMELFRFGAELEELQAGVEQVKELVATLPSVHFEM